MTRFHFTSTASAPVSPTFGGGAANPWDDTSLALRHALVINKIVEALANGPTYTVTNSSPNQQRLSVQFVGPPMSAQTISHTGTFQCFVAGANSAGALGTIIGTLKIFIVSNDGTTVRGRLWSAGGNTAALSSGDYLTTSPQSRGTSGSIHFNDPAHGNSGVDLAILDGDRPVVEVGLTGSAANVPSFTTFQQFGANTSLGDFTADSQSNLDGWIEFSQTFNFDLAQNESDSFTISDTAPVVLRVSPHITAAIPSDDTIRGGKAAVIYGPGPLDGVTERLVSKILPVGWSAILTGSATAHADVTGLDLSSGTSPSSASIVTISPSLDGFDAAIDVLPRQPLGPMNAPYEVASLEFVGNMTGIVSRAALIFDPSISRTNMIAICSSTGGSVSGGIVLGPPAIGTISLRLVRVLGRIYAYFGLRGADSNLALDEWQSLSLIGVVQAPIETGTIQFAVRNLTNSSKVLTRFKNFTTRCHAVINGRLLVNKSVTTPLRIVGNIPAATLGDVGPTHIQVFGPGISGTETAPFRYTLPLPFTTGQRVFDRLRIYTDPALYDPS